MRRLGLALLVAAVLAAGCLGSSDEPPQPPGDGTDVDREGPQLAEPVNVSKQFPGTEPVVDVAPDGTIYLQGIGQTESLRDDPDDLVLPPLVNRVWRSDDGGATWTDVTPPLTGGNASCDGFVAVDGDGTVYAANCYIQAIVGTGSTTLELYRSRDRGETWERLAVPPFPEPMHRMWIVPDGEDTINLAVEALFPHGGLYHLRSTDDGDTWQGPTPVDPGSYFGSDLAVGPDGTQYAARIETEFGQDGSYHYPGPWWMRVSTDDGVTWTRKPMFELEGELATVWQSLAVDEDGTAYMVWTETLDGTARLRYAFSTDQGDSWEGPRTIGTGDASHTLAWAHARGPGELVLTWYEAQERGAPPDLNASWRGHVGVLSSADTADPTLTSTRATPWVVHEGPICVRGPACDGNRELADYSWVDVGPEGQVHSAFADSTWTQPDAFPVYVGPE